MQILFFFVPEAGIESTWLTPVRQAGTIISKVLS